MRAAPASWVVLAVAGLLAVPAAHGGVIAAVNAPVPVGGTTCPTQTDIALIDAATGAKSALPAGVNTPAWELHPSITPDGRRMTFETFDPAGGTTRIRVVDLTTGAQADLFNAFQTAQLQPNSPAITSDAASVVTGEPLAAASSTQFAADWNVTSLASFPSGPFPSSQRAGNASVSAAGVTIDPDVRSDGVLASGVETSQAGVGGLLLSFPNGLSSFAPGAGTHPALSDPTTGVVVFQFSQPFPQYTDLGFRPVSGFAATRTTNLPALVSAAENDELQPAFTPDGRYLGFLRYAHGGDSHMRLFVFDTATQTMLNSTGIDLGYFHFICDPSPAFPFVRFGGISLRETFTLTFSSITTSGLLSVQLASASGVGILVQRIAGHHRLLGRVVPRLKPVGRVPLGRFTRGRHHVHWNLRVNGHRLRRGSYLVTPRLVTRQGIVTELGKPRVLRIR